MIRRWIAGADLVTWLLVAIAAACVLVIVMIAVKTPPACAPNPTPAPTFVEQELPTLGVAE